MVAAGRGAIVNIASITGSVTTEPGLAGYAASKAGVVALTQTTAIEWGPSGVRCNCVSPGQVPTPATQAAYDNPSIRERRILASPLRALPKPADIASVVVFLLSRDAHFINAQNIVVDGGLTHNLFAQVPGREILIEVASGENEDHLSFNSRSRGQLRLDICSG
jgi:NAD(P)-dependent dehydrogenase (short-subunit alcohol dehydrogenase family)